MFIASAPGSIVENDQYLHIQHKMLLELRKQVKVTFCMAHFGCCFYQNYYH
jgi:hypothetical protein